MTEFDVTEIDVTEIDVTGSTSSVRGGQGDAGSALVEFIALAMLLMVPLVYLVLVLARLQAGAFAVQAAASSAAQAAAAAADPASAQDAVTRAVSLALGDQNFSPGQAEIATTCSGSSCWQTTNLPSANLPSTNRVTVTVRLAVTLPAVPALLAGVVPVQIPVQAQATQVMDRFAERGSS